MRKLSRRLRNITGEIHTVATELMSNEVKDTIVFFGSARTKPSERYYKEAKTLARKVGEHFGDQFAVTTGGGPGIMEAANIGATEGGAKSIGLGIELPFETANGHADDNLSFNFKYFFTRKLMFLYHAKAIVVFPGGFGTLDELFETLTLIQCKKITKDLPVILYGKDFWDKMMPMLDHMADIGTISREDLDLFEVVDTPDRALAILKGELTEG